jgi:cholesterol oxidase
MNQFDYDAVVIGSGFGGSVAAYRLSTAASRGGVCVLERGQPYPPGTFPRSPYDVSRSFWDPSEGQYGLYNVWSFPSFGALVSSGLGGGSLIYANVLLRKEPETFAEDGWPFGYGELERHYENAENMLGGQRYPLEHEPYRKTRKTIAMKKAAPGVRSAIGNPKAEWLLPKLAVTFGNEGEDPRPGAEIRDAPPSAHDAPHPRLTCLLTGECDLGCNYGSKNTLDLTYLGHARVDGAELWTSCEATKIAPLASGGFCVTFLDHSGLVERRERRRGLEEQSITAKVVVVAAGTFGSTYLLLRSRSELGDLPRALGTRFSTNGDLLTFLVKAREGEGPRILEANYGPVITSAIRVPYEAGKARGHYVEDAGYPYLVSWLTQLGPAADDAVRAEFRRRLGNWRDRLLGRDPDADLGAELADMLRDTLLSSSSMPLLGMGRDVPSGVLALDGRDRLTCDWTIEQSREYFDELEHTAGAIAVSLGGTFRDSRIRHFTKLVTVHPLGGCPMASSPEAGVVDPHGEVFGYPGLFVADGSALPGPVGPNPALTIAAVAERFAGRMQERMTG